MRKRSILGAAPWIGRSGGEEPPHLHGENEDIVSPKEAQVSEETEPDQETSGAQHHAGVVTIGVGFGGGDTSGVGCGGNDRVPTCRHPTCPPPQPWTLSAV